MKKIYFLFIFLLLQKNYILASAEPNLKDFITQFPQMKFWPTYQAIYSSEISLDSISIEDIEKKHGKYLGMIFSLFDDTPGTHTIFNVIKKVDQNCLKIRNTKLSDITMEQMAIIYKAQYEPLSKKELDIFASLPINIHKKVKPYYCISQGYEGKPRLTEPKLDRRLEIHCRQKKLTPSFFIKKIFCNDTALLLTITLSSLAYTHFVINPIWSSITAMQDPDALMHNAQLEATNQVIDHLIQSKTPGFEHLVRHTINPVPFEYTSSDYKELLKPLMPINYIMTLISYCYATLLHEQIIFGCGGEPLRVDKAIFLKNLLENPYTYLKSAILSPLFSIISIPLSTILCFFSKMLFTNGTCNGIGLWITTCVMGKIFKDIYESQQWKQKSIDFEENKTVAECINKYLNDPSIEIRDF